MTEVSFGLAQRLMSSNTGGLIFPALRLQASANATWFAFLAYLLRIKEGQSRTVCPRFHQRQPDVVHMRAISSSAGRN